MNRLPKTSPFRAKSHPIWRILPQGEGAATPANIKLGPPIAYC